MAKKRPLIDPDTPLLFEDMPLPPTDRQHTSQGDALLPKEEAQEE